MIRVLAVILAAAYGATAQTDADLELLGHVRQHLTASLAELPNYTCQETMERTIYAPTGQIELRERLRLQVLVTANGELFAWPGSTDFAGQPLKDWIAAGLIGTGNFGTELTNLFLKSGAGVRSAGLETRGRQRLYRFDFRVPSLSSRYTLAINGESAITAYAGSFWVNPDSLDIVRLETRAEDIPPNLDCRAAHDVVTYGRVRLGTEEGLLPSAATLAVTRRNGGESRNSVTFSQCRHFGAESSISFETSPEGAAAGRPAAGQPRSQPQLPAGTRLVLRLEVPISIAESAAGDQIVARLDKAVSSGGASLPKGAPVLGRIRRLEQHFGPPASTLVGLEFFAVQQTDGSSVAFRARLTGPRATPDVRRALGDQIVVEHGTEGLDIEDDGTSTGVGVFRVRGKDPRLRRGLRTVWETR